MNVIKRDGKIEKYSFSKVKRAVKKTFKACNTEPTKEFMDTLKVNFTQWVKSCPDCEVSVDDVRKLVEKTLKNAGLKDVLKAAKKERERKEKTREKKSVKSVAIKEKVEATKIDNQNANVDEMSFGGRRGEADSILMKEYAFDNCMSEMAKNNHLENEIYTHDLDSYAVGMHNCLTIPFDKLLSEGFNTRQTDVRPANSVNTAMQLIAVIFQLQSLQQFGGVSASHIDWTMVPYVRMSFTKHLGDGMVYLEDKSEYKIERFHKWLKHDENHPDGTIHFDDEEFKNLHPAAWKYAMEMTEREVYQAVEGMYHNLNTLQSRSGNQLPFTSINYGTCTLPEGRMVIKALLDVSIEGLGKLRKTPIFPCGIFQIMDGVNTKKGDANYDLFQLALKSTSKRLYPNYANVDWSGNAGYDKNDPCTYFSTMGCRTANGWDINGFGQLKDGRGNICPVTIIMPTLAMEAGRDVEKFMELLDKKIHEAKDQLIERFEHICSQPAESARFMYENGTMAGYDGKDIRSALKHGTLAIGQLALAETLQLLIGCDHTTKEGMELAHRIEGLFNKRCKEFKEQYKLNFGVYYTPAENLCHTALKKFREKYGVIENVSDREYFTNSMHVPVWVDVDPFKKIDIESELTSYSNAGCITYVELPSSCEHNIEALETLVLYAKKKDIPYFAINIPNDQCQECGWVGEIGETCPICGSYDIQRLRRVTGYLTGNYTTAFNYGKYCEANDRVKHFKN